jgi:hypothetical protein
VQADLGSKWDTFRGPPSILDPRMAKVVILAWDPDLTQNDPNHHFWVILGQIVGIVVI